MDGQENGLVAIKSGKLYEVQKYVLTDHIWDPFWLLGNRRAIGRLPNDIQATVRREFDRASIEQREDVVRLDATLREQLSAKGLTFVDVDKAPFWETLPSGRRRSIILTLEQMTLRHFRSICGEERMSDDGRDAGTALQRLLSGEDPSAAPRTQCDCLHPPIHDSAG